MVAVKSFPIKRVYIIFFWENWMAVAVEHRNTLKMSLKIIDLFENRSTSEDFRRFWYISEYFTVTSIKS